jgi:hypothetical protein
MRSAIQKTGGPKVKGYPSIAALKPSYAIGILKDPELLPLTRQTALLPSIK